MVSDYASLKASISAYLYRDDITAFLGDIVQNGEIRLAHDLRPTPLIEEVDYSLSSSQSVVVAPERLVEIVSVTGGDGAEVSYVHPADFPRVASQHTTAGYPLVYTWAGDSIKLAPPGSGGTLSVLCYRAPARLSDANTSNWWTANVPNLLLYACLVEAEAVVVNDARIPVWAGLYERGVEAMREAYGTPSSVRRTLAAGTPTGRTTEVTPR